VSEDSSREKILQQNMLNLFDYIDALESRLKVVEEELLRYDFGYDPVETLAKKLRDKETESGTKLWKDKFAMDKPEMKKLFLDVYSLAVSVVEFNKFQACHSPCRVKHFKARSPEVTRYSFKSRDDFSSGREYNLYICLLCEYKIDS